MIKEKLNIGCGWEKKEGFINLDIASEVKPDLVCDIEKGLPFKDNTFTYIYSRQCLEHIRPNKWKFVLNEIARVSKNGCILELYLPFDNIFNRCAIDHYRTFTWGSFGSIYTPKKEFDPTDRFYYSNLSLTPLIKEPHWIIKLFYYMFPFVKTEIYFKFKIMKGRK